MKVWRNGTCIHTLTGHSAAIWAVLAVPNSDLILSGIDCFFIFFFFLLFSFTIPASADKTIRVWRDGKLENTLHGHTDAGNQVN